MERLCPRDICSDVIFFSGVFLEHQERPRKSSKKLCYLKI